MLQVKKFRQRLVAIFIVIVSFISGGLVFLLPVASTVDNPFAAHLRTALAMAPGVLFTGSAIWFMSGLSNFKTRLRIAYVLFSVGMIIFSIAILQLPLIGLLDQWDSAWANSAGTIVIFMASTVFFYLAMRQFSKLLSIRSKLNSMRLMMAIAIGATAIGYVLGTYALQYEAEGMNIYIAAVCWSIAWTLVAAILGKRIIAVIGASYRQAVRWQTIALFAFAFSGLHESIGALFLPNDHWFQKYGFYLWTFMLSGFLFLRACYEFRLLAANSVAVSTDEPITDIQDRDYIESVLSIATLASRPEEIDLIMDEMRSVTANLTSESKLTDDQKKRLINMYHQLEAYLTTKDPLRTFTKEELREHITPGFITVLGQQSPPVGKLTIPAASSA